VELSDWPTAPEPGSAARAAWAALQEGCGRLVAVGGDGTVGEVADAAIGGQVAMGIMPTGTANHFAHELGLPGGLEAAARAALLGPLVTVDAGERLDTPSSPTGRPRHFVLNAGTGFDGHLVRLTRLPLKRRLGLAAYIWAGVEAALSTAPALYTVDLDGQVEQLVAQMVLVTNASTILPGGRRVHPASVLDDGLFGVTVFGARELHGLTGQLLRIGLQWHQGDRYLHYHSAREVSVSAEPPQPAQMDGEPAGTTPLRFRVAPLALRVALSETAARRWTRARAAAGTQVELDSPPGSAKGR
jgi:YegS/Rv2252/BmrU family lipid kinase